MADYTATKNRKNLIVFDDVKANMGANKGLSPIVIELFLGGTKLKISLVFMSQFYLKVLKSPTHYIIMKTPDKRELQQIA